MPKYLTTSQYRALDAGVIPTNMTDMQLASWIQTAETDIDSFMGFDLKVGGFEQHVAWAECYWDERTLRTRFPNFPVPIITPERYRIQVSNISTSGAGFFANIETGDVTMNVFEGYVEIVPLQSVTYALAPVILQLGLQPPIVQLDALVGFYFGVTGETLYNAGDNQTFWASRGFWASSYQTALALQPLTVPPIPPIVYANGVVQSNTYTLNATDGYVKFNSAFSGTIPTITLDYTYTIPDAVKQATIAQTTWVIGQRNLNLLGLQGLDMAASGEQHIKRTMHPYMQGKSSLCGEAASKLMGYASIAVA